MLIIDPDQCVRCRRILTGEARQEATNLVLAVASNGYLPPDPPTAVICKDCRAVIPIPAPAYWVEL